MDDKSVKQAVQSIALLLVAISSGVAVSAADENANKRPEVDDLFRIMKLENANRSTVDMMLSMYSKNPAMAPYLGVIRSFFLKHMGWDAVKSEMAKIYAAAFTKEEIAELIKFYKTPTGKKLIEKQPELQRKAMEIGQQRVQANIAELQQMLRDAAEKRKRSQP